MKLLATLLFLALAGCTASVYHATNTPAQMQADVRECSRRANSRYWMDPVAALYRAYDCLEARGYRRDEGDFSAQVERAVGERPPEIRSRTPCRVPCRR